MSFIPTRIHHLSADLRQLLEKMCGYRRLKKLFRNKVGYELNLDSPRSYNEKIVWKKIYDRNPLLTVTADKYEVRSYLKKVLGDVEAEKILIPLYYVTDKPEDIPLHEIPDSFVIKPNHGSGMHMIIRNFETTNSSELIRICREWLKVNCGLYLYEWAYRGIKKKIIVEQLLQEEEGSLPMDYKLYYFHGKCKYIAVLKNRLGDESVSVRFYDPNWNLIPANDYTYPIASESYARPENLGKMLSIGDKLSKNFDSVRVDLYHFKGRIYFGELTHYPASGLNRYKPEAFDFELGSHWKLQKEYWLKN